MKLSVFSILKDFCFQNVQEILQDQGKDCYENICVNLFLFLKYRTQSCENILEKTEHKLPMNLSAENAAEL